MKEVKNFLRRNKPLSIDVKGAHGAKSKGYLLTNRLAILGPKKDILYTLSHVDSHNDSRYIPEKHISFMDELFRIDDVVEFILEPVRFMGELTYSYDLKEELFSIDIDSQEVYTTLSSMSCVRARNSYLRERKLGKIPFNHMKITGPTGDRTDFIFPGRTDVEKMSALLKRRNEPGDIDLPF